MQTPLILASTSPYRRLLLARLGCDFRCAAPKVDETPRAGETPQQLAERLALAKAHAVAESLQPPGLVIGSDQVADLAGHALGKPGNRQTAMSQLARASGQALAFHTAVCLLDIASKRVQQACVTTTVQFRKLSEAQIDSYLAAETPFDCAGSFKAEGLGITLFERISSDDPTALIGLPLIALTTLLQRQGLDPLLRQQKSQSSS